MIYHVKNAIQTEILFDGMFPAQTNYFYSVFRFYSTDDVNMNYTVLDNTQHSINESLILRPLAIRFEPIADNYTKVSWIAGDQIVTSIEANGLNGTPEIIYGSDIHIKIGNANAWSGDVYYSYWAGENKFNE